MHPTSDSSIHSRRILCVAFIICSFYARVFGLQYKKQLWQSKLHSTTARNLTIKKVNVDNESIDFSDARTIVKTLLDAILEGWSKSPYHQYRNGKRVFSKNEVLNILDHSIEEFRKLPNVLFLSRPVRKDGSVGPLTVCGDTHGQFLDVAHIFEDDLGGFPSADNPFIFNGDMVDRGEFSFEILMSLLVIKLEDPAAVHILRGNHETKEMYDTYGFREEIQELYDVEVFAKFQELLRALPLAAVVNEKVFVTHGGIGPAVLRLGVSGINAKADRFVDSFAAGTAMDDLLWSDPILENLSDVRDNDGSDLKPLFEFNHNRNGGNLFGQAATEAFLERNKLELLVRSHQVRQKGFDVMHSGKCVTVFSAPNYCDLYGNKGAIVRFDDPKGGMEPSFIMYDARHYPMN